MFLQKWCNLCGLELYWRNGLFKRQVQKIGCELTMSEMSEMSSLTGSYLAPSLILYNSTRPTVSAVVKSCSLIPRTRVAPLRIRCHREYKLRYALCHINFRLMVAIFDFRHTRMLDSIPVSLFVLPDPKNMGIAVEISLHSCIEAERNVNSLLLPVNGRHLRFPTDPDVGQSSH